MNTNQTLELLLAHRSVRRFTDDPVLSEDLQAAVKAGQQASTSSNIQAYSAIAIRDSDDLKKLVSLTGGQEKVAECPLFLAICADTRKHRILAERDDCEYQTNLEGFMLAIIDATLFAQNMCVAFESMGYGICYIGGLRNDLDGVQELLKLPIGVWPVFGLCVGRPSGESQVRPRFDPNAVLFEGRYPSDEQLEEMIKEYDERLGGWYTQVGIDAPGWSARMEHHFRKAHRLENARHYQERGASFE